MDSRKMNGQFGSQGVSSADLERGYSDTGDIPYSGENVFNPESARRKKEMDAWEAECCGEDPQFKGGFLEREAAYERGF